MAANKLPIAVARPINSSDGSVSSTAVFGPTLTVAQNDFTGVNSQIVFTADSTEGGRLGAIRFKALGTNVVTVARIFVNNGGAITTAANNQFYDEISLPATTASSTTSTPVIELSMGGNMRGINLAKGFRITVQIATSVAAGWRAIPIDGGSFSDV